MSQHIPLPHLVIENSNDEKLYNSRLVRAYAAQLALKLRNTSSEGVVVSVAENLEKYILNGVEAKK